MSSPTTYALITGASSGIGECFARTLAARRQNVILVARSVDRLDALAGDLNTRYGIVAERIVSDLSLPGSAEQVYEAVREQGLEVDLLVNNAGFGVRGEFAQMPLERQSNMIGLNARSLMELTHFVAQEMTARRRGGIINVSSTACFQAVPYCAAYSATKAFVTHFSMALAVELKPYNIRVVTLCPGGTRTNFFQANDYGEVDFPGGLLSSQTVVDLGLQTLARGGGLAIPGWFNKLSVFVERFLPRGLPVEMAGKMFKR